MLAVDYQTKLEQLLHSLSWKIEIPDEWSDYFEDTGRPAFFAATKKDTNIPVLPQSKIGPGVACQRKPVVKCKD
jgi:hypothetical protein